MAFEKKFGKSLKNKWCLRIETAHPDEDAYDGVVIYDKTDFVALREEKDFEFDGVVIIQKKFVKGIRDANFEKCINKILRHNGEIEKISAPEWINGCESIKELFASIKRRDIWAGIEIVFNKQTDSAFYLGPITRVGAKDFFIKCYDAEGEWEKEYELSYDEVFRVEFDSKYCNHFNKYMRWKDGSGKVRNH